MKQSKSDQLEETSLSPLAAILFSLLDRWTPWRAKLAINCLLLMYHNISRSGFHWQRSLLLFGIEAAWISSCISIVPSRHQLYIRWYFFQHQLPFIVSTLEYCQRKDPDVQADIDWTNERDRVVLLFLWLMVRSHTPWFAAAVVYASFCILLPFICISLMVWILESWHEGSTALFKKFVRVFIEKSIWAWDVCQTLPAGLVEGLPKAIQTGYSRCMYRWNSYNSVPNYSYKPLGNGHIRLLILQRARWILPSTIEASIIHVPADHKIEYEALSYCWGDPTYTHEILIDGARFKITRSAFQLLLACRSVWRDKTVWVDAICIDQGNNDERATQVKVMRSLYQRARSVVSFVSSDYRLRLIGPLLNRYSNDEIKENSFRGFRSLVEGSLSQPLQLRLLAHLLSSNYFRRVWIFQEILAGQRVYVYLGGVYIAYETLASGIANLPTEKLFTLMMTGSLRGDVHDDLLLTDPRSIENIQLMFYLRKQTNTPLHHEIPYSRGMFVDFNAESGWVYASPFADDLEIGLFYTNDFDATDARDKVFAILGLVKYNWEDELLRINYEESEEQVFENVARYLFFHCKYPSANILAFAGTGYTTSSSSYPSWVPQLVRKDSCFRLTNASHFGYRHFASRSGHASIAKGDLPGSILVSGLVCDMVTCLSCAGSLVVLGRHYDNDRLSQKAEDLSNIMKFIEGAMSLADRYHSRWPGLQKQLWRCLIAGGNELTEAYESQSVHIIPHCLAFMAEEMSDLRFEDHLQILAPYDSSGDLIKCNFDEFLPLLIHFCNGRCFGITQHGRMCLLPSLARVGDSVFIPFGAQVPFLIRERGQVGGKLTHELVGKAYVEGMMMGEMTGCLDQQAIIRLT